MTRVGTSAAELRRLPIGAEPRTDGVHFRVWAPRRKRVAVALEGGRTVPLDAEANGHFSGLVREARVGSRYRFALDDDGAYPDPASRFQPEGPHGPSQVVDPSAFHWTDGAHEGPKLLGQVLYELHIGTFTPDGTYRAAIGQLDELARLGVTTVELMPVAEFPGKFGWGYDGVDLFAPTHLYGSPDDLRALVDAAHARGLSIILDVVYNHLGPDGNYLACYAEEYFTKKYANEWGEAINFDGPRSDGVREFFVSNARYWIDEFHFDGLRLDATQQIFDDSKVHVTSEIVDAVRDAAKGRRTLVVGENEPQQVKLLRPKEKGGFGLDMLWNDDFHHTARVAVTGCDEAYYTDYGGSPQELLSAIKYGYLFQGQRYLWQKKRRGTPAFDVDPARFVLFVQNHDQIANSGRGDRLDRLTSPGRYRAITALMLLAPGTPMLFQGQEFRASQPFLYFADHRADLAELVEKGRAEFVGQFPSVATKQMLASLPKPHDPRTFQRCKLDFTEREKHRETYALHRDLLRLRRDDPAFAQQEKGAVDGAVLGAEAFVLRFFGGEQGDRLLLVNLGRQLHLSRVPEPLLAPCEGTTWRTQWSSEDPRYGGLGAPEVETEEGSFVLPPHSATVLTCRETTST